MKHSLSRRLFRTLLTVSLAATLLSLAAIEFFIEDVEDNILDLGLAREQDFFLGQISRDDYQEWHTARLNAFFLGEGQPEDRLPAYLRNRPTPDSAEIEVDESTFLVRVEPVTEPAGRLYLSQDISLMEREERLSQLALLLVFVGMALIGVIISRLFAKRLTRPLQNMTNQIRATEPALSMHRLSTDYRDAEFAEIAAAFNRFLDALEEYVVRENRFVKKASHELRTPLAVIAGALDIIEKRGTLSQADLQTVGRIRRAATDMQSDVNVLLRLVQGELDDDADNHRRGLQ